MREGGAPGQGAQAGARRRRIVEIHLHGRPLGIHADAGADRLSVPRQAALPEVPDEVIARYPGIAAGIKGLRDAGFGILVRDASLGGRYPVMNVTLLHPKDQGCFASFGAHPRFQVLRGGLQRISERYVPAP